MFLKKKKLHNFFFFGRNLHILVNLGCRRLFQGQKKEICILISIFWVENRIGLVD